MGNRYAATTVSTVDNYKKSRSQYRIAAELLYSSDRGCSRHVGDLGIVSNGRWSSNVASVPDVVIMLSAEGCS